MSKIWNNKSFLSFSHFEYQINKMRHGPLNFASSLWMMSSSVSVTLTSVYVQTVQMLAASEQPDCDWFESSAAVSAAPPCVSWRLMFPGAAEMKQTRFCVAGFVYSEWFVLLWFLTVLSLFLSARSPCLCIYMKSTRTHVQICWTRADVSSPQFEPLTSASVGVHVRHLHGARCKHTSGRSVLMLFLLHSLRLWLRTRSSAGDWTGSDMLDVQRENLFLTIFNLGHIRVIWKFPACINLTVSFWFASALMSSLFLVFWFECQEEVKGGSCL